MNRPVDGDYACIVVQSQCKRRTLSRVLLFSPVHCKQFDRGRVRCICMYNPVQARHVFGPPVCALTNMQCAFTVPYVSILELDTPYYQVRIRRDRPPPARAHFPCEVRRSATATVGYFHVHRKQRIFVSGIDCSFSRGCSIAPVRKTRIESTPGSMTVGPAHWRRS